MSNIAISISIIVFLFISCKKESITTAEMETGTKQEPFTQSGFSNEQQEKEILDIFVGNIFEGIAPSPSYYKDDPHLSVIEIRPEDEMEKRFYDYRIIAKNDQVEIEYWVNGDICQLQTVTILGDTDISKWGKYLGKNKKDIFFLFGSPQVIADTELNYYREDRKYGISFRLKSDIVVKIILAGSL
jgi:hypothetical protein